MTNVSQSLRARLSKGELLVSLRTLVTTGRSELEAALAKTHYDFIYLDLQHGPYSEQQLTDFCMMAEDIGYAVEIRIPHTRQTYLIGRFCDFGPSGILVPEVMRPNEVQEAIDFFYYPPVGRRSFGGAARYGFRGKKFTPHSYAAWWNETAFLGIQLESVEAIINARQLAKPGVTYVSFGPTDLQFSLDAHPHFPFRTVEECMRHVATQLAGTGIAIGVAIGLSPEDRKKYIDLGLTVFQEFQPA